MNAAPAWRWLVITLIALLAGVFAYLNSAESVALHLGFFILYQIPLVLLIFVAFLLGMVTMFLLGLRHDLRVRRLLREHGLAQRPPSAAPPDLPPEAPS